jgi:hypothetical protein
MQESACHTERRNIKLWERQVAIIAVLADGEVGGGEANADENKKCFFTYFVPCRSWTGQGGLIVILF